MDVKSAKQSGKHIPGKRFRYMIMFILLSAFVIAIALFLLFYDYSEPSDINPQAHLANSTTKDPFISSTKTHEKSTKVHVHTSSTPYPVTQTNPIRRLIFAHTIFRHGSRAPSKNANNTYYPRGRGQLTDRGYNHSFMLGRFLKKRYVGTGFLSDFMKPSEMEWRFRAVERCLATASAVAAGMFKTEERKWLTVPITTNHANQDKLLNTPVHSCDIFESAMEKACPNLEADNHRDESAIMYECAGSNHPIFQKISIDDSDKYINDYKNNVPVPDFICENIEVISEEYMKYRNLKNGIGKPVIIKFRFGVLIDTLLENLKTAWTNNLANKESLKFKVYSTLVLKKNQTTMQ
ncbi:ACid Phosphatase family [Caenorhabditis elegans]|uniref:ACid Phosphatase family n=1 Tax=Caenorhabditis elegans TaxID=6239 RepID=Q95QK6_CAEEL|nr:ACid Phosphatase family [Caenorhabditis elegans]CAC70090.1 ACid Phosphatase family [Caenorhabditis elegans]|eukprot:NP_495775.1 ACid Phosphatase family [Caenorhabditis elegans]